MCADNFDIAKKTGIAKIGQAMYEGLYRWSDWDFAHAIQKVKRKLAFKRKVKEGLAMGLNNTDAYIRAREPKQRHSQPYMVDME